MAVDLCVFFWFLENSSHHPHSVITFLILTDLRLPVFWTAKSSVALIQCSRCALPLSSSHPNSHSISTLPSAGLPPAAQEQGQAVCRSVLWATKYKSPFSQTSQKRILLWLLRLNSHQNPHHTMCQSLSLRTALSSDQPPLCSLPVQVALATSHKSYPKMKFVSVPTQNFKLKPLRMKVKNRTI